MTVRRACALGMLAAVLMLSLAAARPPVVAQGDNPIYQEVLLMEPQIVSVRPHEAGTQTEGLLYFRGMLYESTTDSLRQVDPVSGAVVKSVPIPADFAASGIAVIGDRLVQLTQQAGTVWLHDPTTLERDGELTFVERGLSRGVCSDGSLVYLSDGTPFLDIREPDTFALVFSGLVTVRGAVVDKIGELECAGDYVYATITRTDFIVKIDKSNGVVVGVIDAANLLDEQLRMTLDPRRDMLNAIAYLPDSDTFLVTGKNWPKMYEVRFVDADR